MTAPLTSAAALALIRARSAPAPDPVGIVGDDPADALARAALAAPAGPGTGWRPEHGDALAEGLLAGHYDAPRLRRLAAFAAEPDRHVTGWRLACLIRAFGADVTLGADGLIRPRGFGRLVPFLRAEARRERDALAAWLRLEGDAPPALRHHARPPFGAAEALIEHREWCIACGVPPLGTVAVWWAAPGSRAWKCERCGEPPPDDDSVTYAYGLATPDPAIPPADAQRAATVADPHARDGDFR